MSDPYRKYAGWAYREIRAKLFSEGQSPEMADLTLAQIKRQRSAQSIAKRQRKESDKQWGEVIEALQHERRIVRSMVRYKTKTPAPEREEFVADYFAVLNKLYEKLEKIRRIDRELPEHTHWTDFVPDRIKEAFRVAADEVPPRDRAKFKQPFQRTSPISLCIKRKARLLRYTRATLETTIERLDEDPENEKLARKELLLRKAIERVNALDDNAHVPNHWAQMVPELMRDDDDKQMVSAVKTKPPKNRGNILRASKPSLAERLSPADMTAPPAARALAADLAAQQKRILAHMDRQPLAQTLLNLIK
jgi:hypothetical protein